MRLLRRIRLRCAPMSAFGLHTGRFFVFSQNIYALRANLWFCLLGNSSVHRFKSLYLIH
jgi:hypothetical protein